MNRGLNMSAIYILFLVLVAGCTPTIYPDFSFSPENPRIGATVTFTNLTEDGGDIWNWTYGDGGYSLVENPTHVFKKPGVYDVTLMADSNKHFVKTKQITVYDTIPVIFIDVDTLNYYEPANFSVLVYNPYSYTVTYDWTFPEDAFSSDLADGKSEEEDLDVYFNVKNVERTVSLYITVGDSAYSVEKTFYIKDVKARSILMAQKDGNVLRQRIFEKGFEDYTNTQIPAGKNPFTICANNDKLYVFDAGSHVSMSKADLSGKAGDGSITVTDMATGGSPVEIVHNRDAGAINSFYSGFVDDANIYWTDFSEFVYKTNKNNVIGSFDWKGNADDQTAVPYYLVKSDRLGYFGNGLDHDQMSSGIYSYDGIYLWAKGGSGKGIYSFTDEDILTANVTQGTPPVTGAILTDFAIRAFSVDQINKKIYFSVASPADKAGFWVANMTGLNAVRIDDSPVGDQLTHMTGIAVDNISNKVYWSYIAPDNLTGSYFIDHPMHRTGVKSLRLLKTKANNDLDDIIYFAPDVEAYGIALDKAGK